MNQKPKIYWIFPVIIVGIIAVYYFYGWEIGAYFHKDATAYDMAQFTNMVNEQINDGAKTGNFYITGISEQEIENINDKICSMNGSVAQYSIMENGPKGMRVMLRYEISDNYYVYQKYVSGQEIPDDRPQAAKLYESVVDILDKIITDDMSDYDKELAIHDYIVTHCKYGYVDYSQSYAYRAYGVLVQGTAVCNGYAEAMALLLSCVGIENEIMTGYADGELHAWNRILLDGDWYQVDSTWDDAIPDRGSFAGHTFFNVTDDIMDDSHTWDKDEFSPCNSSKYNYFEMNNLVCDYSGFLNAVKDCAARNITGTIEVVVYDYYESVYDLNKLFEIPGIQYFQHSNEAYGNKNILTIYLNQRD